MTQKTSTQTGHGGTSSRIGHRARSACPPRPPGASSRAGRPSRRATIRARCGPGLPRARMRWRRARQMKSEGGWPSAVTGSGRGSRRSGQASAWPGGGGLHGRGGEDRRHALHRAFGEMALPRLGPGEPGEAQAVAETIDEGRQIGLQPGAAAAAGERQLQIGQRLDMRGGQHHGLDAEAGIDALQLLGEEPRQGGIVAARPAGADRELRQPAVDAIAGAAPGAARPARLPPARGRDGEAGAARRRPCPRDGGSARPAPGAPQRRGPAGGARSARRCAPAPGPAAPPAACRSAGRAKPAARDRDRRYAAGPGAPAPPPSTAGRRSAATGSGARALRAVPGSRSVCSASRKRASAQAAPGLSATAARASWPKPARRWRRSDISARSPPKRWAQPVISSQSPSAPSMATSGV